MNTYRLLFGEGGGKKPGDLAGRLELFENLDGSYFVEAGAGSGKTACMIGRMAALIISGKAECRELAAVTFTRKASAEMRQRFQEYLEKAAKLAPGDEGARARKALGELDQAYIGTIHSFCARMIRARPIESGLPPDFVELEEIDDETFASGVWREFCLHLPKKRPDLLKRLEEVRVRVSDLEKAYERICDYPDIDFPFPVQGKPETGKILIEARKICGAVKAGIEGILVAVVADGRKLLESLERILVSGKTESPHYPAFLLGSIKEALGKIEEEDGWRVIDGKKAKNVQEEKVNELYRALLMLKEFLSEEGEGGKFLIDYFAWRYGPCIETVKIAAGECRKKRLDSGFANFVDLLVCTRDLLKNHPEIRKEIVERYRRILVDEFQDTDPLQAEILKLLCMEDGILRPGGLMVVGDPKQSIYRFRRADIDSYMNFRREFQKAGGKLVFLTANFRSDPRLVRFFNESIGKNFFSGIENGTEGVGAGSVYQAGYEPMEAMAEDSGVGNPVIYLSVVGALNAGNALNDAAADVVTNLVAGAGVKDLGFSDAGGRAAGNERLAELIRKSGPGDYMVLSLQKSALSGYVERFGRIGLPFEVTGAGDLGSFTAVKGLMQALYALNDPDNPVRLVALLRGPLFGISDRNLYRWRRSGEIKFYEDPPVDPGWIERERITSFLTTLRELRKAARDLPPAAAMEKVIENLSIRRLALACETPSIALGSLEKAVDMVREYSVAGPCSLEDAIGVMETAAGRREGADSMSLTQGMGKSVRIMNLHKAKGLEAEVVILGAPYKKNKSREPEICVQRRAGKGFVAINRPRGEYDSIPMARAREWWGLVKDEKSHQEAEQKRLLYVAATRAKKLLIICQAMNEEGERGKSNGWEELIRCAGEPSAERLKLPPVSIPTSEYKAAGLESYEKAGELLKKAARHSYGIFYPSMTDRAGKAVAGSAKRGADYGKAMHNLLDNVLAGGIEPSRELAVEALKAAIEDENGFADPGLADDLVNEASAVMGTDLWRRISSSKIRFAETPMEASLSAGGLYVGRADIIFRDASGWVLVDFKSGDSTGRSDAELSASFEEQLSDYSKMWEQATGEPIGERWLLFTKEGRAVRARCVVPPH